MIALEDRQLMYEYLMLDLAIKSVQHDIENIKEKGLKFATLYEQQLTAILRHLIRDHQWRQKTLRGKKIRLSKWVKIDANFSDAILATAGEDQVVRFSTHLLKQNTQALIEQRIMPTEIFEVDSLNKE